MTYDITIGTALRNRRTGTLVTVANIFTNGMVLLSNGSYCPQESLADQWVLEMSASEILRREG
jgi:hypothetical protein